MKTREVNRTPVTATELGFGAAVIGNLYRAISDQEPVEATWAAGIRCFDATPHDVRTRPVRTTPGPGGSSQMPLQMRG